MTYLQLHLHQLESEEIKSGILNRLYNIAWKSRCLTRLALFLRIMIIILFYLYEYCSFLLVDNKNLLIILIISSFFFQHILFSFFFSYSLIFFFFFLMIRPPPKSPLFPYPTLSR